MNVRYLNEVFEKQFIREASGFVAKAVLSSFVLLAEYKGLFKCNC